MVTIEYVAVAHFRRKRYRQALDLFRTLLEIDPERAATHAHIGATLHFLDRTEEAIRSLERALSLDPTLETARTNLEEMRKRVRESGNSSVEEASNRRKELSTKGHEGRRRATKGLEEDSRGIRQRGTKRQNNFSAEGTPRGRKRFERGP